MGGLIKLCAIIWSHLALIPLDNLIILLDKITLFLRIFINVFSNILKKLIRR